MILDADEANISSISSFFINAVDIGCSTISTLGIVLDGNLLTSAGNELLLNGIPIATNSSLSTIADWAIDPAISTVQMNGHPIIGSIGYTGTGTVSTTDIQAVTGRISSLTGDMLNFSSGYISTLVCSDISTVTLTVQSTIHSISSISSLVVATDALFVSSINSSSYPPLPGPTVSTFNTASVSSLTVSSINGAIPGSVTNWSQFPAISDVNISTHALNFKPFTAGGIVTGYTNSQFDTNITMGSNSTIILPQVNAFVSQFNVGGLTNPAGSMTVITSGSIGLNSALGVNITGLGGVSVTGVTGVAVNGGGGILVDGGGGILVDGGNVTVNGAGLVSIEGLGGLAVGGGGVAVTGGVVAITGAAGVLMTGGGGISIAGGGGVVVAAGGTVLSPAATISTLSVSTINGGAYPPTFEPPSNAVVSTLVAANYVSTPALIVSTINGGAYPPTFEPPSNAVVSTLLAANYVSTPALIVSTINGGAYPPTFEPPSNAVVSTLLAANYVSTAALFASSINGVVPGTAVIPSSLLVSSLTAANYVSTAALFASSINGYPSSAPVVSSITASGSANAAAFVGGRVDVDRISTYTLTVRGTGGGKGGILLEDNVQDPGISMPVYFQTDGGSTMGLRATSINGAVALEALRFNTPFLGENGVYSDVALGKLYLSQSTATHAVSLSANAANSSIMASVGLSVSSITDISTINGAPYPPPASASIQSTIANGPYNVNIDDGGVISTFGVAYSLNVANKVSLVSNQFGVELVNTDTGNTFTLLGPGGMTATGPGNFVTDLPLYANSLYVSSVNGALYPPPPASIPSDLTVSTLTAATSISTPSLFVSSVNGALYPPPSAPIPSNLTVSTLTAATSISTPSLFVSSVNGAVYPPPSGGSSNGLFSTVQVSSLLTTVTASVTSSLLIGATYSTSMEIYPRAPGTADMYMQMGQSALGVPGELYLFDNNGGLGKMHMAALTELSSINTVRFSGGDIFTQNISAEAGISLAGAGTITINGSTGAPGQVIGIPIGAAYPEWIAPPLINQPISTIVTASTITYTPSQADTNTYFVVATDAAGTPPYSIDFILAGGLGDTPITFSIKNADFENKQTIRVTRDGSIASLGNNDLYPPNPSTLTNSVYCVCQWNGTDLYVY
jgi:hypothetical protein